MDTGQGELGRRELGMLAWLHQGESDVFSSRYLSTPQTSYIIRVGQGKRSLDAIAEQASLVRWSMTDLGGPEKREGLASGKPVPMELVSPLVLGGTSALFRPHETAQSGCEVVVYCAAACRFCLALGLWPGCRRTGSVRVCQR